MIRHFDCGGLRQLQNQFVTDEDLCGETSYDAIDLQRYVYTQMLTFVNLYVSHAVAVSLYHIYDHDHACMHKYTSSFRPKMKSIWYVTIVYTTIITVCYL